MKLTKRLTILYVIALGMIALLTIVGQVVVQRSIRRLEGDSRIVNIAGRQRMLSQRLTRLAIEVSLASIQAGSDDRQNWVETVAMMREDLNTWTVNHAGLQTGSKEMQLPGKNSNAVVQLFQELSPHFDAVKQEIEAVISNSPSSSYSSRRRGFGSNSDAFLVADVPSIYYTTGSAGQNNHGLDFGFTANPKTSMNIVNTAPPMLEIIKTIVGGSSSAAFPVTFCPKSL